jgi:hypothetical protein
VIGALTFALWVYEPEPAPRRGRRYPIEPLLKATGLSMTAVLGGKGARRVNGEQWRAIRDHGLTLRMADELACTHDLLPREVWPSWDDDQLADVSKPCAHCGELFVPTRKGHKFCTQRCGWNHRDQPRRRQRYATDPEYRERRLAKRRRQYAESSGRAERAKARARYKAKREQVLARQAAYRAANRERIRAQQAEYRKANADTLAAKRRARYDADRAAAGQAA